MTDPQTWATPTAEFQGVPRDAEEAGDTYTVSRVITGLSSLRAGANYQDQEQIGFLLCQNPGDEIVEVSLVFPDFTDRAHMLTVTPRTTL
jgi:hypothetical protein